MAMTIVQPDLLTQFPSFSVMCGFANISFCLLTALRLLVGSKFVDRVDFVAFVLERHLDQQLSAFIDWGESQFQQKPILHNRNSQD